MMSSSIGTFLVFSLSEGRNEVGGLRTISVGPFGTTVARVTETGAGEGKDWRTLNGGKEAVFPSPASVKIRLQILMAPGNLHCHRY